MCGVHMPFSRYEQVVGVPCEGTVEISVGRLRAFHFVNDCLESGGIVEREVGENFTVDFDT